MHNSQAKEIYEQWSSGEVVANGIRLHYTRTGGAKPPIVLAHGFSDDGLCWTPVADALQLKFDVIMVDARGHGLSEAPEEGYDSVQMAHDLAGVISGLDLKSPLILGHSMGASTTLTLAGLYPQMPRAILLEDPPAWWRAAKNPLESHKSMNNQWQENTRSWIVELQNQTREELVEKQKRAAPSWSSMEVELWADAHLRLSLNVVNGSSSRGNRDLGLLSHVTCPSLLITAEPEQGAIVTEGDAQSLKELIPQLKVAHVGGAGHSIHREQFTIFLETVFSFLDGIDAAPAKL